MKPELKREYRGEGLYIYWSNPFGDGRKEDVCMFMWPSHAVEDTAKVEAKYESMADAFIAAWNCSGELDQVLEDCAEYFADREDADHDGERYIPNKAMRLRQSIIEVQAKLERLTESK
jgi:hypothetical protein